jgi:pilus assembly protein Flp/PilA
MIQRLKFIASHALLGKDDGVSLLEYALLLALIAVVCIVAITLIGRDASATLSRAAASF